MDNHFYVVSVKHTKRKDPYITLWNPEDKGYCFRTEVAGKYSRDRIIKSLGYYNSGCDSVSVECSVLDTLAIKVKPGYLDDDGLVIPNSAKSWKAIKTGIIKETRYPIVPEYRGAPKKAA